LVQLCQGCGVSKTPTPQSEAITNQAIWKAVHPPRVRNENTAE